MERFEAQLADSLQLSDINLFHSLTLTLTQSESKSISSQLKRLVINSLLDKFKMVNWTIFWMVLASIVVLMSTSSSLGKITLPAHGPGCNCGCRQQTCDSLCPSWCYKMWYPEVCGTDGKTHS